MHGYTSYVPLITYSLRQRIINRISEHRNGSAFVYTRMFPCVSVDSFENSLLHSAQRGFALHINCCRSLPPFAVSHSNKSKEERRMVAAGAFTSHFSESPHSCGCGYHSFILISPRQKVMLNNASCVYDSIYIYYFACFRSEFRSRPHWKATK